MTSQAMAEKPRRACCLTFLNNVFRRNSQGQAGRDEMNPATLVGVFLCGVLCAGVLGVLRAWWTGVHQRTEVLTASLGVLPAGADLTLMDEGYVAMALLGDREDHRLTTARTHTTQLEDHREYTTTHPLLL